MKLLYINTPECDYLQDTVYSGLVKILGKQNVIDTPWNFRFHFPRKKYPRNLGYNRTQFFSRLLASQRDYDVVIVASCNHFTSHIYGGMIDSLRSHVPVVFIDGGDREEIGGDFERLKSEYLYKDLEKARPFDLIFKREYLEKQDYKSNVLPLPFGINFEKLPRKNDIKKYNVSFWGVESNPIRTRALKLLEDKFDCRANGTTTNQTFKKYKRKGLFYLEELSSCKVVLNFRGAGWDTLRYWETPGMETFMISQRPQIIIPDNFENGKHVVFCKDDLSDLIELCDHYVKNDTEREKIATAGYKMAKEKHSDIARAQYVLDRIKKIL